MALLTIGPFLLGTAGCARAAMSYRPEAPETLIGEWTGTWTSPNYPGWNGPLIISVRSMTKSRAGEEWLAHGHIEGRNNDQSFGSTRWSHGFRNGRLAGTTLVISGETFQYALTLDGWLMAGKVSSTSGTATVALSKTRDSFMSARHLRAWNGAITCEELWGNAGFAHSLTVSATVHGFVVSAGVPGMPGFFSVHGSPEDNGRLELLGSGIAAIPHYRGSSYDASFDGKFDSDRYQAAGRLGWRKCVMSISPAQ
jgi:hypothetical protein